MMITTAGTGDIRVNTRTITGEYYWGAYIANYKSVLVNIRELSLDQVRALSGCFMGGESQELNISNNIMIKAIDPSKADNHGSVNRHKIRLRCLSGMVHFIAKNRIKRSRYNSFYNCKDIFKQTHEVTGHKFCVA